MVPRVLFYVQHLLGIGHLTRAATLARAMTGRGLAVTLVSGGEEVGLLNAEGMEFVQLPPVRALDRSFQSIVGADGNEIDDALMAARRDALLQTFRTVQPSVVIVELYPFGRRAMRFELIPLLEAAQAAEPRPRIVCSVRDILVEKNRPEREAEMVENARRYFDEVLVHGDPNFIAFDATFPGAQDIASMLHYTGYVVDHAGIAQATGDQGTGEVIVSSGSGRVGERLLRTALQARPETSVGDRRWRLLAGPSLEEGAFSALRADAGAGVIVERARADFVTLLRNCHLSISQGGYNTVMEVLATGARAVAVPYAGGHETEQTLRVCLLAADGHLQQLPETELTASRLVGAVEAALISRPPAAISINMDGATRTAELVADWAQ